VEVVLVDLPDGDGLGFDVEVVGIYDTVLNADVVEFGINVELLLVGLEFLLLPLPLGVRGLILVAGRPRGTDRVEAL
jgi:hypothetical protein